MKPIMPATSKSPIRVLALCLVAFCLAVLMVACGGERNEANGPTAEPIEQEPAVPDTIWQAKIPNDIAGFLDAAARAQELALTLSVASIDAEAIRQGLEPGGEYARLFAEGNSSYRDGEYMDAQAIYEEVLVSVPTHFGANNNLTLALLQQEKNDEALLQSLVTMFLYPEELGCALNMQVAAETCGYDPEEYLSLIENFSLEAILTIKKNSDSISSTSLAFSYNHDYAEMEYRLDPSLGDKTLRDTYEAYLDAWEDGTVGDPSDPDVSALIAYLEGVGKLNGLEAAE